MELSWRLSRYARSYSNMYQQNCDAFGNPSLCRFFIHPDTAASGGSIPRQEMAGAALWSAISASGSLHLQTILRVLTEEKCELVVQLEIVFTNGLEESRYKSPNCPIGGTEVIILVLRDL